MMNRTHTMTLMGLSLAAAALISCAPTPLAANDAKSLYYSDENLFLKDTNGSEKSTVETASHKRISDSYLREVAYEAIKKEDSLRQGVSNVANEQDGMVFDTVAYAQMQEQKAQAREAALKKEREAKKTKKRFLHLKGYCVARNAIEVAMIKSFATVNCEFENSVVPRGQMMMTLTPMPKAQALVGTPVYVDAGNENSTYDVKRGAVMTADRTSINIANFYNDVLAKRAITEGLMATGNVAAQTSLAYLADERQSRIRTTTEYVNGGGVGSPATPVFTQNQRKPDLDLYLANAAVQVASAMVNVIGQAFLDDIHYIFRVNKGAQFYVDMIVQERTEEELMEDYNDQDKTPRVETVQETRGFNAVPTSGGANIGSSNRGVTTPASPSSGGTNINIQPSVQLQR